MDAISPNLFMLSIYISLHVVHIGLHMRLTGIFVARSEQTIDSVYCI